MNRYTSLLLLLVLLSSSFSAVNAQYHAKQLNAGCSVTAALPLDSDYSKKTNYGLGGSLQADYYVIDQLAVGCRVGFLSWNYPEYTVVPGNDQTKINATSNMNSYFFELGAKYSLLKGMTRPFLEAKFGYNFLTAETSTKSWKGATYPQTTQTANYGSARYAVGAGVDIQVGDWKIFDVSVNYVGISKAEPVKLQHLVLNVGMQFTVF